MPQEKLATIKNTQDVQKLFHDDFNDAIALMPGFDSDFINRPQGKLGTVHCSKWTYEDSVVLMGDAAHAIVPFFGQGMNCGFEDCVNFLKILDTNKNDWKKSILEFEKIQKPNARAIAEMAIENWTEMRDKVGDARFLLRKKVEALLEKEFPEIYKSRYGMVTYTTIPYETAQRIGKIHDIILEKICSEIQVIEDISIPKVKELLKTYLTNDIIDKKLNLETDSLVVKMRRSYS
jgi:kynurenine 3-monooxygenase